MANDVINPYQTFRDNRGKALAGGSLKIYENRTTTIGTAYSDSDLTVAQTVDPYRLDNYGRVAGDLRWSGERTVEVYDSNDALIRTLNDVVTVVDTSGFAINFASVAAMAADTTLEAGDVCETQSYNADQRQGGARYLVTSSSETVDDYLVIDLSPTGLQARLLDEEQNRNFYVAGAIGDDVTDDSTPIQAVLDQGGNIECEGSFRAEGLTLSASARIHGNGTIKLNQYATSDLFTLSGSDIFVWFDGVTLDGDSTNQTSEATTALVGSTVTATTGNLSILSFTNVTFNDPTEWAVDADAADDGQSVLYSFGTCRFLGGLEATSTPYLPGYVQLTDGCSGLFEDCYFDFTTTPTAAAGGRVGIAMSNSTFLNPGYLTVADCIFNRIGAIADGAVDAAAIDVSGIQQLQVSNNQFLSSQYAALLWGAEVDGVQVNGNLFDSLIGDTVLAAIIAEVTTQTTPGNNWTIQDNQFSSIGAVGLLLDGASGGVDAADVSILGNLFDSPTSQAMLIENLDGVDIRSNYVNMESATGINAIEIDTDGVSGTVSIEGNTIVNVDGTALELATGSTAIYKIDSNTIEGVTTGPGINVDNCATALITNNALDEVATVLMALGSTVTTAVVDGNSYAGTAPTSYITDGGVTTLIYGKNFQGGIDSSIASIAGAALPITSNYHTIDSTTAITSMTFAGDVEGFEVVIKATVSVTLTEDATTFHLSSSPYAMTADDTLTLVWDGSAFYETARSVN